MPWRFRKSIKVLPGVKLNLGKKGASVTAGVRGAHVTVGHGKTRTTVGLPGTGISYTHISSNGKGKSKKQSPQQIPIVQYTCNLCGHQWMEPVGGPRPNVCPQCGR